MPILFDPDILSISSSTTDISDALDPIFQNPLGADYEKSFASLGLAWAANVILYVLIVGTMQLVGRAVIANIGPSPPIQSQALLYSQDITISNHPEVVLHWVDSMQS